MSPWTQTLFGFVTLVLTAVIAWATYKYRKLTEQLVKLQEDVARQQGFVGLVVGSKYWKNEPTLAVLNPSRHLVILKEV